MSAEELERDIRRSPTMNERFLLGLLDQARAKEQKTSGIECSHERTIVQWGRDVGTCQMCDAEVKV